MAKFTREQVEAGWKVVATQRTPDDRVSLCGEFAKVNKKGQKYFVIPAHLKVDAIMQGYHVSEEFNPLMGDTGPGEPEPETEPE